MESCQNAVRAWPSSLARHNVALTRRVIIVSVRQCGAERGRHDHHAPMPQEVREYHHKTCRGCPSVATDGHGWPFLRFEYFKDWVDDLCAGPGAAYIIG